MFKKVGSPLTLSMVALMTLMSACSDNKSSSQASSTQQAAPQQAAPVVKNDDYNYKLEPKQVAENIWCFFGALEVPTKENAGNMANSCYIKGDNAYVLWDTGPSAVFAKQAYEAVSKIAGKLPIANILISHEHDDHWLGNSYYKDAMNAEIIGPEAINKDFALGDEANVRILQIIPENAKKGTRIIHVDKFFKDTQKMNIAGINFEYVPVGNAHSKEDWFLYLPDQKVILSGDIVMNGRVTSNRDGSVVGQLKAIDTINSKEWSTLIPGHGFIIDKTATDEFKAYFTMLQERVQKAMDDGADETSIVEAVPMEEFKNYPLYNELHNANVSRAFMEFDVGL